MTEKLNMLKALTTNCHESAIADHVFLTNHRIKWDHFEILATGRSDMHCKIKESLLIRDLKPALNENVGSEKLYLYYSDILVVLCQSISLVPSPYSCIFEFKCICN